MMEIALCEFDNPQALVEVFRRRRAELPIRPRSRQELLDAGHTGTLILVERPQALQPFLDAGVPAGRVYSFQDTCECYRLLPVRLEKQLRERK
jgi:hypothetical protein